MIFADTWCSFPIQLFGNNHGSSSIKATPPKNPNSKFQIQTAPTPIPKCSITTPVWALEPGAWLTRLARKPTLRIGTCTWLCRGRPNHGTRRCYPSPAGWSRDAVSTQLISGALHWVSFGTTRRDVDRTLLAVFLGGLRRRSMVAAGTTRGHGGVHVPRMPPS